MKLVDTVVFIALFYFYFFLQAKNQESLTQLVMELQKEIDSLKNELDEKTMLENEVGTSSIRCEVHAERGKSSHSKAVLGPPRFTKMFLSCFVPS